jgi:acyl carrier protein
MNNFEQVRQILAETIGIPQSAVKPESSILRLISMKPERPAPLLPTTSSVDRISPDSLDLVELTLALEEGFDIEVSDSEGEAFILSLANPETTVQDLVRFIDERRSP